MSDALLTEISKKRTDIHGLLHKASNGGAGAGAVGSKPAVAVDAAAVKAAADKKAAAVKAVADKTAAAVKDAQKVAADKAAAAVKAAAAKPAGPASGTKAPGGKHTIDDVRDKIREVATNAALGRSSATDILDADGGGVKTGKDLKPENYDKVYEACQVALQSEGSPAADAPTPEDDLM